MSKTRCAARSALFITKINSHHFEIFSSLRDSLITSMTSTRVAPPIDLRTNEIFVTLSIHCHDSVLIRQREQMFHQIYIFCYDVSKARFYLRSTTI